MDDFTGNEAISLQPHSVGNIYRFAFLPAASTDGKGAIPYNTNISSVAVSAYNQDTGLAVNDMVGSPSVSANVVTVALSWPGDPGTYKLTFLLRLDNNAIYERDFNNRIYAEDL